MYKKLLIFFIIFTLILSTGCQNQNNREPFTSKDVYVNLKVVHSINWKIPHNKIYYPYKKV